jgi:hypothetical protein
MIVEMKLKANFPFSISNVFESPWAAAWIWNVCERLEFLVVRVVKVKQITVMHVGFL